MGINSLLDEVGAQGGGVQIECVERNDVLPLCPHCGMALGKVWVRPLRSTFGKRYIYFCPACRKVLGLSHRKGFWMG